MKRFCLISKLQTGHCAFARDRYHQIINHISKSCKISCRLFTSKCEDSDDAETGAAGSVKKDSIQQRLLDMASGVSVPPEDVTQQDSRYSHQYIDQGRMRDRSETSVSYTHQRQRYDDNKFRFSNKWKPPYAADGEYTDRKVHYRRTNRGSRDVKLYQGITQDDDDHDHGADNRIQGVSGRGESDEWSDRDSPDLMELEFSSRSSKHFGERKENLHFDDERMVLPGLGKRGRNSTTGQSNMMNKPKVQGEMLFGIHPVRLALKQKRRHSYCLYVKTDPVTDGINQLVELAGQLGVPVSRVNLSTLDTCSNDRPHQGVCLDVSRLPLTVYDSKDTEETSITRSDGGQLPIWLLLYHIQDPMNFGAILRSAYLFGVDRVLNTRQGSCSLTPVVCKASAGVMEVMDIFAMQEDIVDFIKAHQEMGWSIAGTWSQPTPAIVNAPVEGVNDNDDGTGMDNEQSQQNDRIKQPVPVEEFCFDRPTIVVVGNEGEGIPDDVLSQCDHILTVWNQTNDGEAVLDSLNVSVATGIILHSMALARQKK